MALTSNSSRSATSVVVSVDRATLRRAWQEERSAARAVRTSSDASLEWHHLERAHILSQPMAGPHVLTHMDMLRYGIRHRDRREIIGQLFRLLVAAPGTWAGKYPVGNTGAASVSAFEPMPMADDLAAILEGRSSTKESS